MKEKIHNPNSANFFFADCNPWWKGFSYFIISLSMFRCKNHEELMETLKDVNQIIQQSARLRIGKSKVKPGNMAVTIFKI